jgi:dynein light intermediate chain 1, cytosolic
LFSSLDTPKLGVWILDGDVACSAPLLKFALKADTLENSVLILVASMTQPWSLLSTLKKWTSLVEEHLDRLGLDPARLRELRDRLQYDFQHYTEPLESSIMLVSSSSSTTLKSGVAGRIPNSISSVSLASTITPSNLSSTGDEQVVLPLPEGVLTKSLGIPVIVIITKVTFALLFASDRKPLLFLVRHDDHVGKGKRIQR